jgi:hypothetical protein
MSLIRSIPRSPRAVAIACLAVAAAFALIIALSIRGPETVETQGTLTPTTAAAPGSAPPRTSGTVPTTPPPTEAPTTTVAPTTVAPTAPPPRPAPTTRPTPVVPEPEPRPAPAEPAAVDPFRLRIEGIGVDAPIIAVGVEPGTNAMEIPGLDDVGWYEFGSLPGDAAGTAVLVGHVDGNGRPGVFANLRDLAPGDTFTVTLPDGRARTFAVTGLQQFDKQALPSDLFARGGPPRLALITCGGPFDPATGHYLDNVVVVAAAI